MPAFSRGFRGRRVDVDPARVPPGQYEWSLTINGAGEPVSWPWEEFVALPRETVTADREEEREVGPRPPAARRRRARLLGGPLGGLIVAAPERDRRRGQAPLMLLNRKCRAGEDSIQGGAG
jgi:hypothetical protein